MNAKQEWLRNNLKKGELYAGLILGENSEPDYHLIALPLHKDKPMKWTDAMAAAAQAKSALPNRRDGPLLFVNLNKHFKPARYWTCEQYAGDDAYAWCQDFTDCDQYISHEGISHRVVLVRRIPIEG